MQRQSKKGRPRNEKEKKGGENEVKKKKKKIQKDQVYVDKLMFWFVVFNKLGGMSPNVYDFRNGFLVAHALLCSTFRMSTTSQISILTYPSLVLQPKVFPT